MRHLIVLVCLGIWAACAEPEKCPPCPSIRLDSIGIRHLGQKERLSDRLYSSTKKPIGKVLCLVDNVDTLLRVWGEPDSIQPSKPSGLLYYYGRSVWWVSTEMNHIRLRVLDFESTPVPYYLDQLTLELDLPSHRLCEAFPASCILYKSYHKNTLLLLDPKGQSGGRIALQIRDYKLKRLYVTG